MNKNICQYDGDRAFRYGHPGASISMSIQSNTVNRRVVDFQKKVEVKEK